MNENSIAITRSGSIFLSAPQEQRLKDICRTGAVKIRQAQGTEDDSPPGSRAKVKSWLWWRQIADASYRNDFRWRQEIDELWKHGNYTLNIPQDHLRQHFVEVSNNLLRSERFFGLEPEGIEDQKDMNVIKAVQKHLQNQSKEKRFRKIIKKSILRAMICGEQVLKPSILDKTIWRTVTGRIMLNRDGSPIMAGNKLITDNDEWVLSEDGQNKFLAKDKSVAMPANAEPIFTMEPRKFIEPFVIQAGSSFDLIDPEDLIVDPRWEHLDKADLIGYQFMWSFDELFEFLAPFDTNKDLLDIYADKMKKTPPDKVTAKENRKANREEDDDFMENAGLQDSDETQARAMFREYIVRADIMKVGHRQNIWCLIDHSNDELIAYEDAAEIVTWNKAGQPYVTIKCDEMPDKWWGVGYYENMFDDLQVTDSFLNRIYLEVKNSGNIPFMNPKAIKNVKDGGALRTRTNKPNVLENNFTPDQAFGVITITPQVAEMSDALNLHLQRASAKNGLINAGQSATSALPAMETATGQQILENKGNAHLTERIETLAEGIDDAIRTFSKIELDNLDVTDIAERMGPEQAAMVQAWVQQNSDNYADSIETLLTAITDSTTLAKNDQIMAILQTWIAWPAPYQEIHRPAFAERLRSLGVNDPDKYLVSMSQLNPQNNASAAPTTPGAGPQPTEQPAAQPIEQPAA